MARLVRKVTQKKYLCLAGGVELNCVSNGKLLRSGIFEDIYIQPATGDAGGSIGSALIAWYQFLGNERKTDGTTDFMNGAYLGPQYSNESIKEYLDENGFIYSKLNDQELAEKIVDLISEKT